MKWFVRGIGFLIRALAAISLRMARTQPFDPRPYTRGGIDSLILALELVRSADDARAIFRDPLGSQNRKVMRLQIREDWYFIATYWANICGMAFPLARRRIPGAWVLGGLVLILATGAAVYDIRENQGILRIIAASPSELTDEMARATRNPSLMKWGLIFAVDVLLSPLLLRRTMCCGATRLLTNVAGALLVAAAVVGFYGLALNPEIGTAMMLMSGDLAAALPLFLGIPDKLL